MLSETCWYNQYMARVRTKYFKTTISQKWQIIVDNVI